MAKQNRNPGHLSATLRARLAELGIAPVDHHFEGLLEAFPAEFDAAHMNLDLPSLAKVLIHFCDRGLIRPKLRKTRQK